MKAAFSDRIFLLLVAITALAGFAIFSSATLGLLARQASPISHDILVQAGLGLGLGFIGLWLAARAPLAWLKRAAPYFYGATLLLTALVFVPGIGFSSGGATRWLNLGFTTMQPAELLKIGFVLAFAWWLAPRTRELSDWRNGLAPLLAFTGASALILLAQPNTSTTLLILATGAAMYFAAGAPWRDFAILAALAILALGVIAYARPYVLYRIETYVNPSANPLGSGYQIQQSLIAIGSGGLFGRGFGQSAQKFNYLPEPDGDSVFAVFAEETGFVGALLLIALFFGLSARGIVIAGAARDLWSGLVALGLSFMIVMQAFINVSAMLGIIPLTGLPLPFVSHGGTALAAVLLMCGLILNVARNTRVV